MSLRGMLPQSRTLTDIPDEEIEVVVAVEVFVRDDSCCMAVFVVCMFVIFVVIWD
jgi:hypothetical protein